MDDFCEYVNMFVQHIAKSSDTISIISIFSRRVQQLAAGKKHLDGDYSVVDGSTLSTVL